MDGPGIIQPPFEYELYRRNIRNYGESNLTELFGIGTTSFVAPTIRIDTGTPLGANRERVIQENLSSGATDPAHWTALPAEGAVGAPTYWKRDHILECFMATSSPAVPSNEQRAGIGMSNFNLAVPWPDPSLTPFVGFWVNCLTGDWELVSVPGEPSPFGLGSAWNTVILTGVEPWAAGKNAHMKLVYKAGEYVAALIDGVEGARIDDPAMLPLLSPIFFNNNGNSLMVHSGSLAGRIRARYFRVTFETLGMM